MANGLTFSFNEAATNDIYDKLTNIVNNLSEIKDVSDDIDASLVSGYADELMDNIGNIKVSVNTLLTDYNNLYTSFGIARDRLKELSEYNKRLVYEGLFEVNKEELANKILEVDTEIAFYMNYPEASSMTSRMSVEKLSELLLKNGAKDLGNNNYSITIDKSTYRYNARTGVLTEENRGGKIHAIFLASSDADFNNITNTITIMGGTGTVNTDYGAKEFNAGFKANKNSLIILPFGKEIGKSDNLIMGSAKLGSTLVGGRTKKIKNNVIGYSYGGMLASRVISKYKGVYDNIVFVNSGIFQSDLSSNLIEHSGGDYSNFNDMQIIFFEGDGDRFIASANKTIKTMIKNGVPKDNFYVYTNDKRLLDLSSELGSKHVIEVTEEYRKSHKGWRGHSYGNNMIIDSNIVNYLSRI